MKPVAAIGAALLLTIGGCSEGGSQPAAAQPAAPSPSPARPAKPTYQSVVAVANALTDAGLSCTDWTMVDNPTGALERGSCKLDGSEVTIGIYARSYEAAGHAAALAKLVGGIIDLNVVNGENWTIGCDTLTLCQRVEAEFGGNLISIPK